MMCCIWQRQAVQRQWDCQTATVWLSEKSRSDLNESDAAEYAAGNIILQKSGLQLTGSKQNVKLTMVNGKILYEDGQFFISEEPQEIYKKANEIVSRMK